LRSAQQVREQYVSRDQQPAAGKPLLADHASARSSEFPSFFHQTDDFDDRGVDHARCDGLARFSTDRQKVRIDRIGLDMSQAWKRVEQNLREHPNLLDVKYNLLMLSPDAQTLDPSSTHLKGMCDRAAESLSRIETDLDTLSPALMRSGRKLEFEVKTYKAVPVVHGFRVVEPFQLTFLAFCRWGPEPTYHQYDWNAYHIVRGKRETDNPSLQDLLDIYLGFFYRHWSVISTFALKRNY
jgi:hypothetical protein